MRKRLRKKKHIGEFQEFGVEVMATLKPGVDFDTFLDDFIREAVEANGLAFGGGGQGTRFSGFLELGPREVHASNLEKVVAWFTTENRIETYRFSEPVDVWHGS